ncbi:hypothetical protein VPH35_059427 [Triticum aestivum]|uniref:Uncharacterized protein n=1 Tax=Aegilops tauschii subsp. strangulata TaxID=200361 RepID=A0A453ENA9_AEGTS
MKEREAGVPTTKMSRSRGVRWDGGAGGLAVAVEEVGAEEELSAGQGQAGQKVSAGLEDPGGEAGATRGLAEGQRGALAWRSPTEGRGGALPRGWRRKTVCFQTRGISVLLYVFTWLGRTPSDNYFGTEGVLGIN